MESPKKRGSEASGSDEEQFPQKKIAIRSASASDNDNNSGVTILIADLLFKIAEYFCVDFKDVVRFSHAFRPFRSFLFDEAQSESNLISQGQKNGPILSFLKEKPFIAFVPLDAITPISIENIPKDLCGILKNVIYAPAASYESNFEVFGKGPHSWVSMRCSSAIVPTGPNDLSLLVALTNRKSDSLLPLLKSGCDPISLDIYAVTPRIQPGVLSGFKNLQRLRIGESTSIKAELVSLSNLRELNMDIYSDSTRAVDPEVDPEDSIPCPFEKLTRLESLKLKSVDIPTEWLDKIPNTIKHFEIYDGLNDLSQLGPFLETLESCVIHIQLMYSADALQEMTRALMRRLRNTKSLWVSGLPIRDVDILQFTSLESLTIGNVGFTLRMSMDELLADTYPFELYNQFTGISLRRFKGLKSLSLAFCNYVTEESVRFLTQLEDLKIDSCGQFEFTEELAKSLTKLKSLTLRRCPKVSQSKEELIELLLKCRDPNQLGRSVTVSVEKYEDHSCSDDSDNCSYDGADPDGWVYLGSTTDDESGSDDESETSNDSDTDSPQRKKEDGCNKP